MKTRTAKAVIGMDKTTKRRLKRLKKTLGPVVVAVILVAAAPGAPGINISVMSGNLTTRTTQITVAAEHHPEHKLDARHEVIKRLNTGGVFARSCEDAEALRDELIVLLRYKGERARP